MDDRQMIHVFNRKAIRNLKKLFKAPDGTVVKTIRVSTLAMYYYCAAKAWITASGMAETPPSEILEKGRKIHDDILNARQLSVWEKEFQEKLNTFFDEADNGTIARPWFTDNIVIEGDIGWLVTHGIDDFKVTPERKVTLLEYKTKSSRYITPIDLAPAVFQIKLYAWLLRPYLEMMGYEIVALQIVFLMRSGKPIGEKHIEYISYDEIEEDIQRILNQFNDPKTLIPPMKFKCLNCPEVFKSKCPFQQ